MSSGRVRVRANVGGLAVPLAVVGFWQLLVSTRALDLQFLPAPSQIASALIAEVTAGEMAPDLAHTLAVALLAIALAAALGGGLGVAVGLVPALRVHVMASIDFLRTVPAVALMPVALLTLGPRITTELALATYAATWPILLNTAGGVAAVSARLRDVARTLRFSPATTVRKIIIPAAVPSSLVGARVAAIIALHVTVIAEMVISPAGLGGGLIESLHGLNPARMWAYALVCGLVGYLLHAALRQLVRLAMPGSAANPRSAAA